jgi:hypothetical protein
VKTLASLALLSFGPLLVAACSAAPGAELTGATAQADTVSQTCPLPFTYPVQKLGTVCTPDDPDDGTRKRHCGPGLVTSCVTQAAAPVVPAAGYPSDTPLSCADMGGTPVAPPTELSSCTSGYSFNRSDEFNLANLTVAAFLCPAAVVAQVASEDLKVTPEDRCTMATVAVLTPANGCFGAPVDPTSWGYVQVRYVKRPNGGTAPGTSGNPDAGPTCGLPTNCGNACIITLGPID